MNQSYEQYDVIIIGSGKSGQAAINTMKEQGIKALLIELEPHTVATMVNQSLIKPQPSSPIYHTTENQDASLTHHIAVHKQVMSTTINQTVTYTLYASAVPDADPVIVEADQTNKNSSTYMSSSYTSQHHNDNDMIVDAEFVEFSPSPSTNDNHDDDLEVVEPEWVENQDDHDAFSAKFNHFSTHRKRYTSHQKMWTQKETMDDEEDANHEGTLFNKSDLSLRAKLHRRKTFSQANQMDETDSPVEFDSFSYKAPEQQSNWSQSSTPIAPNKEAQQEAAEANKQSFLHTLLDQPLHLERESRLRKRFINKQRIENQQKQVLPSPDDEMQNEGFYQVSPLSKQHKLASKKNHTTEIHEDLTAEDTQSDLLQADSNLTLKRTRAQKKKRMFGKQDNLLFETRIKKPRHKNIQTNAESEPETVYHFDSSPTPPFTPPMKENHFTFESENVEESPSMEEHHVDTSSSTTSQANQQGGGDALKRDTIEFEEPYGYSSWEDFVTPYSSNNRKRQEMDQVEKRKIALRGLHNLINNLG